MRQGADTRIVRGAVTLVVVLSALLAGCVPARWPTAPEPEPTAVPPVAKTPKAPRRSPPAAPGSTEDLPDPLPRSTSGNPAFYEVLGRRYFVLDDSTGYDEQGIASWYGKDFHGKRTSSGTVYDMHSMTAAHKTLPLPTLVRVTNLDNGRSVVVTVDDRGPFVKDRLIDLSYAAAMELDIVKSGTGRVRVEAVPTRSVAAGGAPATESVTTGKSQLYLQVGAYSDQANATRMKARLEADGISGVVVRRDDTVRPTLYHVRIGPLVGAEEYDLLAARMGSLQIENPRLVMESPAGAKPERP